MGQSLDANMKSTWQITQSPVGGLGRTGGKERNFPCGPTQGVPPESPSPRLFPTCIGDLLSPGTVQCLCLSSDCCNKNIIDFPDWHNKQQQMWISHSYGGWKSGIRVQVQSSSWESGPGMSSRGLSWCVHTDSDLMSPPHFKRALIPSWGPYLHYLM